MPVHIQKKKSVKALKNVDKAEIYQDSHKKKMRTGTRVLWGKFKKEFMSRNLSSDSEQHISVSALAREFNIVPKTAQNKAAKDKWYDELRGLKDLVTDDIKDAIFPNQHDVVTRIKADSINEEVAVRKRHLVIARNVLIKASMKLKNIKPEDLTIREALDFMKLGITEERRALGIPDETSIILYQEENHEELNFSKANSVIGEILDIMKDDNGDYTSYTPTEETKD